MSFLLAFYSTEKMDIISAFHHEKLNEPPGRQMTNVSATNLTRDHQVVFTANWTTTTVISLAIFLSGLVNNGTILFLFAKNSLLRTPFNVYLINLLLANVLCLLFQYPLDISNELYSETWQLGPHACTVYLYGSWVLQAVIFHSHSLIAVNRIWAIVHPLSYRSIHSTRTAAGLCVAVWVSVHLVVAPGLALDALYYRLPEVAAGCFLDARFQRTWSFVTQVLFFFLPHLVMLFALPIFCCAQAVRRRQQRGKYHRNVIQPVATPKTPHHHVAPPADVPDPMANLIRPVADLGQKDHACRCSLLTVLTISITVCWTPIEVYYALGLIMTDFDVGLYYEGATMLFSFQATLDPILFTLSLKSVRLAFRGLCRSRSISFAFWINVNFQRIQFCLTSDVGHACIVS